MGDLKLEDAVIRAVVEAAGNGGMNLDSEIYDRRFDRSARESGAISLVLSV